MNHPPTPPHDPRPQQQQQPPTSEINVGPTTDRYVSIPAPMPGGDRIEVHHDQADLDELVEHAERMLKAWRVAYEATIDHNAPRGTYE